MRNRKSPIYKTIKKKKCGATTKLSSGRNLLHGYRELDQRLGSRLKSCHFVMLVGCST